MKVTLTDSPRGKKTGIRFIVLNGLNTSVLAGDFMDLVQKKFYNGVEIQQADGFVVQLKSLKGQKDMWREMIFTSEFCIGNAQTAGFL